MYVYMCISLSDIGVTCELEDVTTAIDLEDVYSKIKSKAGAINIFHKQKRYVNTYCSICP